MKALTRFGLLVCLVVASAPQAFSDEAVETMPGYVDFGELADEYGEPSVMINLGGTLMQFLAAASKNDPEAQALLSGLKAIRVNVYQTGTNAEAAKNRVSEVKRRLQKRSWEPIVQVQEDDEIVHIFVLSDGTDMEGITLMAVSDGEAVFVNIIGRIDPAQLSAVMEQLDVDVDIGR